MVYIDTEKLFTQRKINTMPRYTSMQTLSESGVFVYTLVATEYYTHVYVPIVICSFARHATVSYVLHCPPSKQMWQNNAPHKGHCQTCIRCTMRGLGAWWSGEWTVTTSTLLSAVSSEHLCSQPSIMISASAHKCSAQAYVGLKTLLKGKMNDENHQ